MAFYKMQVKACNITAHHILKNEVDLIYPKFHKRHNALYKAVKAMSILTDAQRNQLMHLEKTLDMYGIYNAETLENLVKTVHTLYHRQSKYESLFAGQTSAAYKAYSQMHGAHGIQHYVVNSMLYLCSIKDKYIKIYKKFILQLHIYAKAVRVLAKGYLPISLVTPLKLQEILDSVKKLLLRLTQIMTL